MIRLLAAFAVLAPMIVMSPSIAMADPEPCPVTDPPVINRCGYYRDTVPTTPPPPPGVKVFMCQDGSISFTEQPNYRGTCAENGGVAKWVAG